MDGNGGIWIPAWRMMKWEDFWMHGFFFGWMQMGWGVIWDELRPGS